MMSLKRLTQEQCTRTFIKPEINRCLLRALPCDVPLNALHELELALQDWPILSHYDRFEIKTLLF